MPDVLMLPNGWVGEFATIGALASVPDPALTADMFPGVLETVRAVLAGGGNLEASARALYVHPNTVRYRLKRATELTGCSATDPRGAWTLQLALALAQLEGDHSLWH